MTTKATQSLRDILTAPVATKHGGKKHPALALADTVEKLLFSSNKFRRAKSTYTTDELWGLFRAPLINHFGLDEEGRLRTWVYDLKGKGRVQVLNVLCERLEAYHPGLTLPRRTAKPRREE